MPKGILIYMAKIYSTPTHQIIDICQNSHTKSSNCLYLSLSLIFIHYIFILISITKTNTVQNLLLYASRLRIWAVGLKWVWWSVFFNLSTWWNSYTMHWCTPWLLIDEYNFIYSLYIKCCVAFTISSCLRAGLMINTTQPCRNDCSYLCNFKQQK